MNNVPAPTNTLTAPDLVLTVTDSGDLNMDLSSANGAVGFRWQLFTCTSHTSEHTTGSRNTNVDPLNHSLGYGGSGVDENPYQYFNNLAEMVFCIGERPNDNIVPFARVTGYDHLGNSWVVESGDLRTLYAHLNPENPENKENIERVNQERERQEREERERQEREERERQEREERERQQEHVNTSRKLLNTLLDDHDIYINSDVEPVNAKYQTQSDMQHYRDDLIHGTKGGVDIFGWVDKDHPVEICVPGNRLLVVMDARTAPRQLRPLDTCYSESARESCAKLEHPGTVAIIPFTDRTLAWHRDELGGISYSDSGNCDVEKDDVRALVEPEPRPEPNTLPVVPIVTQAPRADGSIWHQVQYGQNCARIARAYGLSGWNVLYEHEANKNLQCGPGLQVGTMIQIREADTSSVVPQAPRADGSIVHTVQAGDTCEAIAKAYGLIIFSRYEYDRNDPENERLIREGKAIECRSTTTHPTGLWQRVGMQIQIRQAQYKLLNSLGSGVTVTNIDGTITKDDGTIIDDFAHGSFLSLADAASKANVSPFVPYAFRIDPPEYYSDEDSPPLESELINQFLVNAPIKPQKICYPGEVTFFRHPVKYLGTSNVLSGSADRKFGVFEPLPARSKTENGMTCITVSGTELISVLNGPAEEERRKGIEKLEREDTQSRIAGETIGVLNLLPLPKPKPGLVGVACFSTESGAAVLGGLASLNAFHMVPGVSHLGHAISIGCKATEVAKRIYEDGTTEDGGWDPALALARGADDYTEQDDCQVSIKNNRLAVSMRKLPGLDYGALVPSLSDTDENWIETATSFGGSEIGFKVLARRGLWYKVRYLDDVEGWILGDHPDALVSTMTFNENC